MAYLFSVICAALRDAAIRAKHTFALVTFFHSLGFTIKAFSAV